MTDQRKTVGTLSDFHEDANLIVEVTTVDEITYEIPIRKLTLDEWVAAGRGVEDPPRIVKGSRADGSYVYDDDDPAYIEGLEVAAQERLYRRILACLRIDIPGKTIEAQVKAMRKQLPADITQFLGNYLMQLHNSWRRKVEARAESFPGLRVSEDESDTEDRQPGVEPPD